MTEVVPEKYKSLDYKWTTKYKDYQDTVTLKRYHKVIDKVALLDENTPWTFKEEVQRYLCRVLWLMRNPGYGFAFWIFGKEGKIENMKILFNQDPGGDHEFTFAWDTSKNILVRPWTCRFYQKILPKFFITGYIGWKIPYWQEDGEYKAMLATRIVPRFRSNK